MTDNKKQDNIFFSIIEEDSGNTTDLDLNEITNLINYIDTDKNEVSIYLTVNYKEKYTVKELLLICEYYGFAKDLKNNKCNKDEIIEILVIFETNKNNVDIVSKRQNMWNYMNELKNDKFMKKYVVLW